MKKKPKRLLFFTKELKKIGTTGHFERNFCGSKNSSKIRIQSSNPVHYSTDTTKKSERQDLNLRPPPPQGGTLPSCATSRFQCIQFSIIGRILLAYATKFLLLAT